jgi:hypothetical protein
MAYHDLMTDLGLRLALAEFEFGDEGAYFEIEDRPVFLRHEADGGRLSLATPVEMLDERDGEGALRLLRLSFAIMRTAGHAVALDPDSGAVMLMASLSLDGLSAERLHAELLALAGAIDLVADDMEAPAATAGVEGSASAAQRRPSAAAGIEGPPPPSRDARPALSGSEG